MSTWPILSPAQERKLQFLADEYKYRLRNHPRAEYLLQSVKQIARRRAVELQ